MVGKTHLTSDDADALTFAADFIIPLLYCGQQSKDAEGNDVILLEISTNSHQVDVYYIIINSNILTFAKHSISYSTPGIIGFLEPFHRDMKYLLHHINDKE
jgi:hypothetical protein